MGRCWRVHFERSTNGGNSRKFIGPVNNGHEIQAIQSDILFHPDNRLQAFGRTQPERLFEIWSEDGGLSWGRMSLIELPNNNSGAEAVTLRDGRNVLVYRHTGKREDKSNGERSPLNVALSQDGKAREAALVPERRVPPIPSLTAAHGSPRSAVGSGSPAVSAAPKS
jgi:alpha-L-rhamnosidase